MTLVDWMSLSLPTHIWGRVTGAYEMLQLILSLGGIGGRGAADG